MSKKHVMVKLTTSEVIVGKSDSVHVHGCGTLDKPLLVAAMPSQDGNGGVQMRVTFLDFLPGIGQDYINLQKQHVVCTCKVDPQLIEMYERMTNPNYIETPQSQGLVIPQ